jgi:hypothetical protein
MAKPRKPGKRHKSGKLAKPTTRTARNTHDYGNDRCVARLDSFRHKNILAGKAAWIDIFDGIGQLHAIGMLDGHGIDGKLMREAGREYVGLYNYYFIDLLPKGSDLERAYGGKSGGGKSDLIPPATRREIRFAQLDDLLPKGSQERYWTQRILLNHFGLDTVEPLVDRLVNYKFNQWGLPLPEGDRDMRTAGADDFQNLGCVLRGLFALADGVMPDRWKMAA